MSSMLAATGPSPLWYLTRAAGAATLVLLTATLALGIVEVRRWRASGWPRFVIDQLHRNASLIAVSLLAVHVLTTLLDGFAPIGLVNAVIPFTGHYRPFWLGLGALALDLVLALVLTSLMRRRLGRRAWRLVHWTAYACWPIALLHALGTGTDPKAAWMLALTGSCVAAVLIAVCFRVAGAVAARPAARGAAYLALATSSLALVVWLPGGPLAAGWARRAGTPTALLPHARRDSAPRLQTAPRQAAALRPPFSARLAGTVREGVAGRYLAAVELPLALSGRRSGVLDLRLTGRPLQDGGVQMTSSAVTLGTGSNPRRYRGRIVALNGSHIVAVVSDSSAARLRLDINLRIDTSIGRATGAVRAT